MAALPMPPHERGVSTAATPQIPLDPDDQSQDTSAALTRIALYDLGKKLGEGAFGAVRLATHRLAHETAAIKCVDVHQLKSDYELRALERELDILQRLHHPHCIKLLEIIRVDHLVFMVMEKADVDLLSVIVEQGPLSEDKARKYTRDLIAAVAHIHQQDIVHRDIKVENLMLAPGDRLLLIDFGLGNTIHEGTKLETWCGSMAYSAPELLGQKPYGKEVDIWGIGVCLYVMLAATLPFPADSLTKLHAAILDKDYTSPPNTTDALRDLLDRTFEFKPKKVWPCASSLRAPIIVCEKG